MGQILFSLITVMVGATLTMFPTTLFFFAQGNWHLGKRLLAATAVFGFVLAFLLAVRWLVGA
jgi:uncharacterized membrane protein YciS (DUF1049 family)